jgi:Rrf2 family protein
MPVTARAEYACLAMLELANRYADPKPVRLTEITDKHAIPERFLVQILLQLKTVGLVTTTRGKAGGYQLAKRPEEVTLADIVGALDGRGEAEERPEGGSGMSRTLQALWGGLARELAETRTNYLTQYRLSDLLMSESVADYSI